MGSLVCEGLLLLLLLLLKVNADVISAREKVPRGVGVLAEVVLEGGAVLSGGIQFVVLVLGVVLEVGAHVFRVFPLAEEDEGRPRVELLVAHTLLEEELDRELEVVEFSSLADPVLAESCANLRVVREGVEIVPPALDPRVGLAFLVRVAHILARNNELSFPLEEDERALRGLVVVLPPAPALVVAERAVVRVGLVLEAESVLELAVALVLPRELLQAV